MLCKCTSGKLTDAAIYWASGGKQIIDSTEEDAKAFGLIIEKQPEVSTDFEVWEDNWEIVMMFLRIQTQWNMSFGGVVGLKYEVLLLAGGLFDLYNVENRQEMLEGLQLMESVVLREVNKEKKSGS
ncbi:DUF1799 domain-containing protein [Hyphomonas sp.]|uniref:DUF1799 domain-containing protein n=1 Tax=Hyphomonas sp. TaxID=87 RepID=UPI000C8E3964|nr:hypothetical protein [Hyphomonas sp.]